MKDNYLLKNETAVEIYRSIKTLPILDYHCHLSAKEIFEDNKFSNIGEMWLGGDHYKWRLMRQAGIDEEYITGKADWKEKFIKFAEVISMCVGNPLFSWCKMELSMYFGIETPLNKNTAESIFEAAQKVIDEKELSPRKLIKEANVRYIATTDDPADTLDWHRKLKADKSFDTVVVPAFRPDNILNLDADNYTEYMAKYGDRAGVIIDDLGDLRIALRLSLDAFCDMGASFSDVGIEGFPSKVYSREEAEPIFNKAIKGEKVTAEEKDVFLGYMFNFLAGEYKKHDITMQLHLGAARNINTSLYLQAGRDVGGDSMGDAIEGRKLYTFFDTINSKDKLPKTIVYTLNPQMNPLLASICGTFRDVVPGAAWWFCDHKRGIEDMMLTMAEESYFPKFMGMLTDSRSFLSYARHDYFRRILSSFIADWVIDEEFPMENARYIAYLISYGNVADLVDEKVKEHLNRRIIKYFKDN